MRPLALQATPQHILRGLVDDLGLQPKELRAVLEAEQRSIERWMSGEVVPQKEVRRRLTSFDALHAHLGEAFTNYAGARAWLRSESRYLAGMTPLQVLRGGGDGIERVEEALTALDAGIFL